MNPVHVDRFKGSRHSYGCVVWTPNDDVVVLTRSTHIKSSVDRKHRMIPVLATGTIGSIGEINVVHVPDRESIGNPRLCVKV